MCIFFWCSSINTLSRIRNRHQRLLLLLLWSNICCCGLWLCLLLLIKGSSHLWNHLRLCSHLRVVLGTTAKIKNGFFCRFTWAILIVNLGLNACFFLFIFPLFFFISLSYFGVHYGIIVSKSFYFTHVDNTCSLSAMTNDLVGWLFRLGWLTSCFGSLSTARWNRSWSFLRCSSVFSCTSWVIMGSSNRAFGNRSSHAVCSILHLIFKF